jgi:hypothetical protein
MPSETTTTPEKIRLVRPAHVYYSHTDLDKAHEFLLDFGFAETQRVDTDKIYYRGYGPDPFVYCATEAEDDVSAFGGVAFVVESEADLERASKTLPRASSIYDLTDAPGGGKCVTFHDPVDGFPFHLVFGQVTADDRGTGPRTGWRRRRRRRRRAAQRQPDASPVQLPARQTAAGRAVPALQESARARLQSSATSACA